MIDVRLGNSLQLIHDLSDKSIDCVVTSPPYWGLRDYKTEPIVFDGAHDCEHEWVTHKSGLVHENRNNCKGTQEDVLGQTGTIYIKKYDDKTAGFCSKCGAWAGQLGLEPTPQLFVNHLLDFFSDVKSKLKDEGNCFVNLGDTYSGSGNGFGSIDPKNKNLCESGHKNEPIKNNPYPAKCLCLIPERFVIGMVDRGWICRNDIIWYKKNHMPESVRDRWAKAHEIIYFFTKQRKNYFNLDAIKEPLAESSIKRITQKNVMNQNGGLKQDDLRGIPDNGNASRCNLMVQSLAKKYETGKHVNSQSRTTKGLHENRWEQYLNLNGKNPGDVWNIPLKPYRKAHFAVFPYELVRMPILAACPENGTVLDCFAGSGTVGEFCRKNNRNAILFELNPDYKKLIEERTLLKTQEITSF